MNKVIVLDPGHGGNATVGSSLHNQGVSATGVLEKTMTLDFALIIRNALLARSKEITVVLTRETDINLSLAARAGVAAAKNADLFVSIHFNAAAGGRGVESWIRGTKRGSLGFAADRAFARRVQDAVLKAWGTYTHATRDLEVKNDDARELGLGVLKPAWLGNVAGRSSLCRACLVLLEFMSDPEVDRLLNTGDNVQGVRKKIAGSLADALLEELGISFSVPAEPATPIVEPSVPVPGPKVDRHEENLKERSGEVPSLARYLVQFFKGDYHQRQESANAQKCVAYVEQHFNSGRASDGYSAAVTARNASAKSMEWGRAYAKAIAREFNCKVGGDDGIAVGGFGGRGNENLCYTNMPAILLEPLFASDPVQAALIRSDSGQERLARVLVATIRQFFPEGGLIAFSVGHKYKTSHPEDRGTEVVGGGLEADFAELVLQKAEKLLTARMEDDAGQLRSDSPQRRPDKLETLPDANAEPAVQGAKAVRNFSACKREVSNRGIAPEAFLNELVDWGLEAPDEIFAPSDRHDIYTNVSAELGPCEGILHRKAVMLEVLRVLGGFESSWKWDEGRDTTNAKSNTAETEEAGLFQISADAMNFDRSLKDLLSKHSRDGKTDAKTFKVTTKNDHAFAIEFAARLLRFTVQHNGPVKDRKINEWLHKDAVEELKGFLAHSPATSPQLTA
jgi:N-acetylmuramoyl-L-alanine amidase